MATNAKIVMDALRDINEKDGITVITNLHTLDTARTYCERIIGMAAGKIVFDGGPNDLNNDAVQTIYGTETPIEESMTSTAIKFTSSEKQMSPTPLVLAGA